eukprot:JP447113.1.p2 GENE.JP447113.1~~JP447113.1.p2  ORF type:complete len:144 (-),score=38.98 JP447113.1:271-681(-)
MRIICEGRPGGDIVYTFKSADDVAAMSKTSFTLKEGCNYKIQVTFRVHHQIVSGLKYLTQVYRKGLSVAKENTMLGSFGPQDEPAYVVTFPRRDWEVAPSGMLARGHYTAKSKYVDDDNQTHLAYEYAFDIKKDWE